MNGKCVNIATLDGQFSHARATSSGLRFQPAVRIAGDPYAGSRIRATSNVYGYRNCSLANPNQRYISTKQPTVSAIET
jgi:hypothetical protein